jgi:mannosylglucosylglycerate synthase
VTQSRILIVHYTPPDIIGGVEHIIHQHIGLLCARGFEVAVVAGRASERAEVCVVPEIDAAGAENARIEAELADGAVTLRFHQSRLSIMEQLQPLAENAEVLIAHNAFTLHFNLPLTAALWQIASDRRDGSTIAWCHDLAWTNPLYIPTLRQGYPWDLIRTPAPNVRYVTVSHQRQEQLAGLWEEKGRKIEMIPNGVDVPSFLRLSLEVTEIANRYRLFDRDVVLLLPARLTRRKNVETAIHATRSLKERGLDVLFLVTGPIAPHHPGRSRSYLDQLKALRSELGVEKEVIFLADELGRNPGEETVSQLYSLADALLYPSAQEGFGLPILEAGLARVPAIVSDIPVFREVGGKDVWTFPVDEPADRIAGQVVHVLRQPSSRLYRRVLRDYRWDAIVDQKIVPLLRRAMT